MRDFIRIESNSIFRLFERYYFNIECSKIHTEHIEGEKVIVENRYLKQAKFLVFSNVVILDAFVFVYGILQALSFFMTLYAILVGTRH